MVIIPAVIRRSIDLTATALARPTLARLLPSLFHITYTHTSTASAATNPVYTGQTPLQYIVFTKLRTGYEPKSVTLASR